MMNSKEKLLNCARKLFSKQDFDSISIREIAKKAGVNSACIKYHFKDKMGLYEDIFRNYLKHALEEIESISDKGLPPKETLNELFDLRDKWHRENADFLWLVHRLEFNPGNQKIKKMVREKYIVPLDKKLQKIFSDCRPFKSKLITVPRLVLLFIGLPNFWSIFGRGFVESFEEFTSMDDIREEALKFSRELIFDLIGV